MQTNLMRLVLLFLVVAVVLFVQYRRLIATSHSLPEISPQVRHTASKPRKTSGLLCTVVRNEPINIVREWASFHLQQGFGRVVIYEDYDNSSQAYSCIYP
jgi:hypothetical protein